MNIKHSFLKIILIVLPVTTFSQSADWTVNEKGNYQNIRSICEYYQHRTYDSTQRNFVFDKFVYFDNILNDTSVQRMQSRLPKFDGFFSLLLHFVDSVGIENLDAKPTRYFKSHEKYFLPFSSGRELQEVLPNCLTYFDKRRPDVPLGTLLFEERTHKIYAWILLSQADYYYFLTFNLL